MGIAPQQSAIAVSGLVAYAVAKKWHPRRANRHWDGRAVAVGCTGSAPRDRVLGRARLAPPPFSTRRCAAFGQPWRSACVNRRPAAQDDGADAYDRDHNAERCHRLLVMPPRRLPSHRLDMPTLRTGGSLIKPRVRRAAPYYPGRLRVPGALPDTHDAVCIQVARRPD